MRAFLLHPLFLTGLILRLTLMAVFAPAPITDWYAPFLSLSISSWNLDPWSLWLAAGGTPVAFPYGIAMWMVLLPGTLVSALVSIPVSTGYLVTLLLTDCAVLFMLAQLVGNRTTLVLWIYWLSPIVLIATYVLGFNDLIPVALLVVSLYCVRSLRLELAGFFCIAAVSSKLSMVIALPFFLIYLFNNRAMRQLLFRFILGGAVAALLFGLPFLLSRDAIAMLFGVPEMVKIFNLSLDLGGTRLFLVPLMYLVLLYVVWRVRRLNNALFEATLGVAFLMIVLSTHAEPGWFIWALPFLVFYQAQSDRMAIVLSGLFSVIYVISALLVHPVVTSTTTFELSVFVSDPVRSLLQTGLVALGVILIARMWRETVSRNDFFRLSRSPFVMGVAGDSGAGKDVYSKSIEGLFGAHSVVTLSGDSYHLWDRQKPMWQVMTHLNPMANDVEGFTNDLVSLMDGRSIQSRNYDHESGRMSRPESVESRDFIIANGLHALYLPLLRDCYHLSVYLDIDENLRRFFKLRRDMTDRGHTREQVEQAFVDREEDSTRFIRPQQQYADLVLSLQPIHQRLIDDPMSDTPLYYRLVVRTRQEFNERSLVRILVGVCGLHVDLTETEANDGRIELVIEGDTSADDISMAASILCPRILEFLDIDPAWQDGVTGLMQLITLSHINQALTRRFL